MRSFVGYITLYISTVVIYFNFHCQNIIGNGIKKYEKKCVSIKNC